MTTALVMVPYLGVQGAMEHIRSLRAIVQFHKTLSGHITMREPRRPLHPRPLHPRPSHPCLELEPIATELAGFRDLLLPSGSLGHGQSLRREGLSMRT